MFARKPIGYGGSWLLRGLHIQDRQIPHLAAWSKMGVFRRTLFIPLYQYEGCLPHDLVPVIPISGPSTGNRFGASLNNPMQRTSAILPYHPAIYAARIAMIRLASLLSGDAILLQRKSNGFDLAMAEPRGFRKRLARTIEIFPACWRRSLDFAHRIR